MTGPSCRSSVASVLPRLWRSEGEDADVVPGWEYHGFVEGLLPVVFGWPLPREGKPVCLHEGVDPVLVHRRVKHDASVYRDAGQFGHAVPGFLGVLEVLCLVFGVEPPVGIVHLCYFDNDVLDPGTPERGYAGGGLLHPVWIRLVEATEGPNGAPVHAPYGIFGSDVYCLAHEVSVFPFHRGREVCHGGRPVAVGDSPLIASVYAACSRCG